jgi:4-alpha-glucanotransferase
MRRGSGILLHLTSLPSQYGIGDMGPEAFKFVDFLYDTKQSFWQILPLNPTYPENGNSPYRSSSTIAGNTFLISPDILLQEGLLEKEHIEPKPVFLEKSVDYIKAISYKERLFNCAYELFKRESKPYEYEMFCSENEAWLDYFALFVSLSEYFKGKAWSEWPKDIKEKEPESLQSFIRQFNDRIEKEKFLQYVFFKQWFSLKNYCNNKGIQIIGDMPIYVNYHSADLWNNSSIFKLDKEKRPTHVAGVPPDYFSETGQLWGDPVYNWNTLKEMGYSWWIQRMKHSLILFDIVRIDHFRGFQAYWEVPASEKTALNGKWIEGPGEDFFNILLEHFPYLPIIAEDLGVITPDVREIIKKFDFPGMKILLFAFDENLSRNPYAPHNNKKNCVVYTGTHDNNTVKGWLVKEATSEDKNRLFQYIGHEVSIDNAHWEFIKLAMMSVANMVIIPIQDILGLGEDARMNLPATSEGNWEWRLELDKITPHVLKKLREMTDIYGRA